MHRHHPQAVGLPLLRFIWPGGDLGPRELRLQHVHRLARLLSQGRGAKRPAAGDQEAVLTPHHGGGHLGLQAPIRQALQQGIGATPIPGPHLLQEHHIRSQGRDGLGDGLAPAAAPMQDVPAQDPHSLPAPTTFQPPTNTCSFQAASIWRICFSLLLTRISWLRGLSRLGL